MKKGFTLIELLAVIVILAIIALIAVPTITGLVEKAKKGGAEQSANGYIDAVNKQIAINQMDSNDTNDINEGIIDAPLDSAYDVKVKGQTPKEGWIEVTKNGVNRYSLVIGDYVVSYDGDKVTIVKGTEPNEKPSTPTHYVYVETFDNNYVGIGTHVGYPLTPGINLGQKFIKEFYGSVYQPFDSEEDCTESYAYSSCSLRNFYTDNIKYETAPGTDWNSYLRFSIDDNEIIKKIDLCGKYNDQVFCLENSSDGSKYDNNKRILNTVFGENSSICSLKDVGNKYERYECQLNRIKFTSFKLGGIYGINGDFHFEVTSYGSAFFNYMGG